MTETWPVSVDQLLHIFRRSLLALLPVVQEARIPWKEGEAYDDWDEIAQCLYRNIVARSLQSAIAEELELDNLLPRYNTLFASYSNQSYIEVNGVEEKECSFVAFATVSEPFDAVDYLILNASQRPSVKTALRANLNQVRFRFRLQVGAKNVTYDRIRIEL